MPHLDRYPIHDEIWKIPMALKELIAWKGQYTAYILNNPKATFNFTKNSTHTIQTCVRIPFVFMIRQAKYDSNLGLVTCINCSFHTCINNSKCEIVYIQTVVEKEGSQIHQPIVYF